MKKIRDYAEISPLIRKYLKPGVATNCMLAADDFRREIAAETLFSCEWDGGVAFLRKRDGFFRGSYYVTDQSKPVTEEFPENTVMEIVFRPGADRGALEFWKDFGFHVLFSRIRMARDAAGDEGTADDGRDGLPQPESVGAENAERIFMECFDARTACLPTLEEIRREDAAGLILSRRDEECLPTALLRVREQKKTAEICQLCVLPVSRGKGFAASLTEEFVRRYGAKKCLVWVREDYEAPQQIYRNNGFAPDGWQSVVLLRSVQAADEKEK